MAEIVFDRVTKRYSDGTVAVRELSLEIGDGEFMILVGPSGCGKTTALRMIAGLEELTAGELRIDGEVVSDRPPKDRDVAMVFQSYALYPHMSVRQNMAFGLKRGRVPKEEIRRKVEEAARLLDLTDHLDRKPGKLSGGQRQRVAMGRAIVRDPKAFLMDEPLSNLDAKLRVQMRTEIARLQRGLGTTTVYVTHDQVEAMMLGDRVAVMRDGVIQQVGAPGELYGRPANLFVAAFIGSPAMNLMPARVEGGALRVPFGAVPLPATVRARLDGERPLIAGIRPEDLHEAARLGPGSRHTFTALVDVLEATGSDVYAHLALDGGAAPAERPGPAVVAEPESDEAPIDLVARLDATTAIREGSPIELALDPARIHLFDAETGERVDDERSGHDG